MKGNKQTIFLFTFFLFVGFFSFTSEAQTRVWIGEDHQISTEKNGLYYRPAPAKKRGSYVIIDYYKNGNKYREGKAEFSTVGSESFNGMLTYYFKDGIVAKKEKYRKGKLNGPYKEFYPTGELKVDGGYDRGNKEGVWKIYYKTGKIKTKGKYRDGEKVGVWKTFYKNVYYPEDE